MAGSPKQKVLCGLLGMQRSVLLNWTMKQCEKMYFILQHVDSSVCVIYLGKTAISSWDILGPGMYDSGPSQLVTLQNLKRNRLRNISKKLRVLLWPPLPLYHSPSKHLRDDL